MKKVFFVLLTVFIVFSTCSCQPKEVKEALRVRIFYNTTEERDDILLKTTELLNRAESKEECEKRLSSKGYVLTEEYYEATRCEGRFYPAGYYDTYRVGSGDKGCQFICYPMAIYQSMEEYDNAKYGSFFYEIIKKMEERD